MKTKSRAIDQEALRHVFQEYKKNRSIPPFVKMISADKWKIFFSKDFFIQEITLNATEYEVFRLEFPTVMDYNS